MKQRASPCGRLFSYIANNPRKTLVLFLCLEEVISMAHAGGKPRKWKSAKALAAAVEEYFSQCKEEGCIPSVAGLALSLGFMSRQALERYTDRENEDNPDEYVVIITRAKRPGCRPAGYYIPQSAASPAR